MWARDGQWAVIICFFANWRQWQRRLTAPDTRMQSLSLRTAILKSKSLNIRGRNAIAGARPVRIKMVEQNKQKLSCRKESRFLLGASKRQPRCSSTAGNLAAVHGPLQATRTAPTTRPTGFTRVAYTAEPLHERRGWNVCKWLERCRSCFRSNASRWPHLIDWEGILPRQKTESEKT